MNNEVKNNEVKNAFYAVDAEKVLKIQKIKNDEVISETDV